MQARNNCEAAIEKIQKGGIAEKAGMLSGDTIVSVNGHKVRDIIDLMFFANEPHLKFIVKRKDKRLQLDIDIAGPESQNFSSLGIELAPFKVRTCRNNCVFCFVSQLPKGLRRPLYIKDEDYRMSFLYGGYITLTNLSDDDKKRIVEQRLSPLYISVHSTDREIRNKLLGNQKAADILKEIKFLAGNKIRMHTQVVLCPDYNDGKNLEKTISDLYRQYPYVASIAVVPVGLTMHRKKAIKPVGKEDAAAALNIVHKFQSRFRKKHGDPIVYASDELYIKAGIEFPPLANYGDLPQIENGVGLVPLFLYEAKKIKAQAADKKKKFITFTGSSFYPYLTGLIAKLRKADIDINAVEVENTFFGNSVTVAGLLTGRDIIKSLSGAIKKNDILLIPDVVMREGDNIFLDDVSLKDIEDILDVKAVVIESTPKGLMDAISKN
jgi:putative radical SAM enzyme (TIGR03279 family)